MRDPQIDEVRDTLDIDLQHGAALGGRHELLWGLEYRWTRDRLGKLDAIEYDPSGRAMDLISLFIQDQVTLVENRLWFIIGAKLENGYFTDWELQPTGRLLWKPREAHTFWTAVSRAVRTPSRTDADSMITIDAFAPGAPGNPTPFPLVMRLAGSESFTSETLTAYEAGYRFQPSERLFIDLAFFYNEYGDLYAFRFTGPPAFTPGPPPILAMELETINEGEAQTWGMEAAINVLPVHWWRLHMAYSWFGASDPDNGLEVKGLSPAHQIGVRSSMDLPWDLELELWPRYVDELSTLDVDACFSLDIRLGWRPSENLDVSLAAQNMLGRERPELQPLVSPFYPTAVERGVYGKITWRF